MTSKQPALCEGQLADCWSHHLRSTCVIVEICKLAFSWQWRHNGRSGLPNRQPHDCLLNRLFRHRSQKTSKLRVTGLCEGNSPVTVNSPYKGRVTRKMFPFDDVIIFGRFTSAITFNTLRPRQNGRHFPDNIFKYIFVNENVLNAIKISLKFVPKGPIDTIPALLQIMDWRCPGDKPLSKPTMVSFPAHIYASSLCLSEYIFSESIVSCWDLMLGN